MPWIVFAPIKESLETDYRELMWAPWVSVRLEEWRGRRNSQRHEPKYIYSGESHFSQLGSTGRTVGVDDLGGSATGQRGNKADQIFAAGLTKIVRRGLFYAKDRR